MNKLQENWNKYVSSVPVFPAVGDEAHQAVTDDVNDYLAFAEQLPPSLDLLAADSSDAPLKFSSGLEHHWCLCDMPEGEFPRVHIYQSLSRLVESIVKREGQETAVWVTYGVPLRLTKPWSLAGGKKVRYLLLPNNLAAVVSGSEPFSIISQDELPSDIEIQDEGWLGDPEYLNYQDYYLSADMDDDSFTNDSSPGDDDEDQDLNSV